MQFTMYGGPDSLTNFDVGGLQFYSNASTPANPYCCDNGSYPFLGADTNATFFLVNGGWQPIITMQVGKLRYR